MLEPSIYKPAQKFIVESKEIPPPPPLPKYDPNEEAPMWSYHRSKWSLPVEKPVQWTKIGVKPESDDKPDWRGIIRSKVTEYPMPEPYNLDDFKDKPAYYFFDTPDYADPFKKLAWSSKFFLKTGALLGCVIALIQGRHFTLGTNIWMATKVIIPWWSAGMASSATVVTVANLRGKKDDYWNYAAAGQAAAMVYGRKCVLHWIRATALCMPAALAMKWVAEENMSIFPQFNYRNRSWGLSGMSNERGIVTGDLRFGFRARNYGDPGRDVRKTW